MEIACIPETRLRFSPCATKRVSDDSIWKKAQSEGLCDEYTHVLGFGRLAIIKAESRVQYDSLVF